MHDCVKSYPPGTRVRLASTPDASAVFAGWTGACRGKRSCTVTMQGSKSVTAVFNARPVHTITYASAGGGSGSVGFSPTNGQSACSGPCKHNFHAGTEVALNPAAAPGSVFSGWSGACRGKRTCTILMRTSRSVTATFTVARKAANSDR